VLKKFGYAGLVWRTQIYGITASLLPVPGRYREYGIQR
jgi:hypothetical protein